MAKRLVIVESPAKAKTVNRYLGNDYVVKASMGHIMDLPTKGLGVDVDHDFKPEYQILPERKPLVSELKKTAGSCEDVILAADPDREGEAICWHLKTVLESANANIFRVLFHEITKKAVEDAFRHLGQLDEGKIKAQQTRRILDRLVGYKISPLLWKKIGRGLSAGRVQSIALRLICEREKEIKDFTPEEYWTITAHLEASNLPTFEASLAKIDDQKSKVTDGRTAAEIVSALEKSSFLLDKIEVKEKKRYPSPPFITSTLQQESFRRFKYSVKKTMSIAQKLYEGLEIGDKGLVGLITYMRTDSVRVSDEAVQQARSFIEKNYPSQYLPKSPRVYKNKRKAQDAHEAIRPTSFNLPPEAVRSYLKKEQFNLYLLIWNRFLAAQMAPALLEETDFSIKASRYLLKAKGEVIKFDGFFVLYPQQQKNNKILPEAEEGEKLKLLGMESKQNFTQPPPRYTEGSLVKELETKGIGRPSTYGPIIATIQGRDYVLKEKGKFIPTEIGLFVNEYLINNFPDLMEFKFTAKLEVELDSISEGQSDWLEYLRSYYSLLDKDLQKAMETEGVKSKGIPLDDTCPECGKQLVIKDGRYGRFRACSGYPDCKYKEGLTKKEVKTLEEKCPECGSRLVVRKGRYGVFTACSNYPECKYIKKEQTETDILCPKNCGGKLIKRKTKRGKIFYGCGNFPKCDYATWDEPVDQSCPKCGRNFILRKTAASSTSHYYCSNEKCDFEEDRE